MDLRYFEKNGKSNFVNISPRETRSVRIQIYYIKILLKISMEARRTFLSQEKKKRKEKRRASRFSLFEGCRLRHSIPEVSALVIL